MLKKVFTLLLCGLLFETILAADAWAIEPNGPVLQGTALRVKNAIQRIGTGSNSLLALRLRDKTVVSGWVSDLGPESFELVNTETGKSTVVRFADVRRLAGMNILNGESVHYGTGVRAKLSKIAGLLMPARRPMANKFAGTTILIVGIVLGVLIAIIVAKTL